MKTTRSEFLAGLVTLALFVGVLLLLDAPAWAAFGLSVIALLAVSGSG